MNATMKKVFNFIFKVLFYAMTLVNIVSVIAYIVYIAVADLAGMESFVITYGILITANVIANVFIGKKLTKDQLIKLRKLNSISIAPKNKI